MSFQCHPQDQFVIKIAGRCNIACQYCYMYELGDDSALRGPPRMTTKVLEATAKRLIEHAEIHKLSNISVALHGGEPLMIGPDLMQEFCLRLKDALGNRVRISLQTNGMLLNASWLSLFSRFECIIGISLDGPKSVHDLWRTDKQGKGTYERAITGFNLLLEASRSGNVRFGGVISVLNPMQDATLFYSWAKELQIPILSVLLPDANYESYQEFYPYERSKFYQFLRDLFDLWWADNVGKPKIRMFENILRILSGGSSDSESIGSTGASTVIIETDGSIQPHDVLRMNQPGRIYHRNVLRDPISTINSDPIYRAVNLKRFGNEDEPLPTSCRDCPVKSICKGGFVGHRYSAQNGYDNPSIYCETLFKTITHIYLKLAAVDFSGPIVSIEQAT